MKISFRDKSKINTFSDKNPKGFVANRPALEKMLKEVLQAEGDGNLDMNREHQK